MKRKSVAVILTAAMLLTFAGCGTNEETTAAPTEASAAQAESKEETSAEETETEAESEAESKEAAAESDGEDFYAQLAAQAEEGLQTSITCDPIEISLGCSGSVEGTMMGYAVDSAIEAVNRWTNGAVVINFYPGGQLGGDTELIQSVAMGSVDMFVGSPSGQVGMVPELAVLDIGGLFKDLDSCNKAIKEFMPKLEEAYNKAGLHLGRMYATDFRELTANKPIRSLEDLQGLNIRVQENEYHMLFWSELGCNATPLAFGELYIALQQGMMDAEENPWGAIVGAKMYEVQPNITLTHHIPNISTYVVSNTNYQNWSEEQRLALDQFFAYVEAYQLAGTEQDNLHLREIAENYGCVVEEASDDLREAFGAASGKVIEKIKSNGIDAEFVDAFAALAN